MSDGWDDLFSAAAGADTNPNPTESKTEVDNKRRHPAVSVSVSVPVSEQDDSFSTNTKEKRKSPSKKKKRKSSQDRKDYGHHDPLDAILKSRIDPIGEQIWSNIPSWISVGRSLSSKNVCSQWKQKDTVTSRCSLDAKCENCGMSLLHHSFRIDPSMDRNKTRDVLELFLLLRNIRCCASSIINETNGCNVNHKTPLTPRLVDYAVTATRKSARLVDKNVMSYLSTGESSILISKFQAIAKSACNLKGKMRLRVTSKDTKVVKDNFFHLRGIFDEIVRLIIDCDDAYFRLYYLQNAGFLPALIETAFIPHPPTYFGSRNVAWNGGEDFEHIADLVKSMKIALNKLGEKKWHSILETFGIGQEHKATDPLSYMHKNRLSESIFIFHKSGWIHSDEAKKETKQSLVCDSLLSRKSAEEVFYDKHETAAPPILKEWRDSCRDLLCNLYAYATMSPRNVLDIKNNMHSLSSTDVLEMGAGTGYIAHLLSDIDLKVSAYDVAPTKSNYDNTVNEYHGSSPPFFNVQYARPNDIQAILGKKTARRTALLLSYPPPLSDMAKDALTSFIRSEGGTVIHIGEFQGLTGSASFEKLLTRHFELRYRAPCTPWGTDAAEVTVWSKKEDSSKEPHAVLVPCSQCHRASTMRCKLSRPLSYCSMNCFNLHKDEREAHFAFSMIPPIIGTDDILSSLANK